MEGCSVEPPPTEGLVYKWKTSTFELPQSVDEATHTHGLRLGDTVDFAQHSFRFQLLVQPTEMAPRRSALPSTDPDEIVVAARPTEVDPVPGADGEVQVQSSDHGDDAATESENEAEGKEDVDQASTVRTSRTEPNTPATSHQHATGTVLETPGVTKAIDEVQESDVLDTDDAAHVTSSPLVAKTARESQNETQLKGGELLTEMASDGLLKSDAPSTELGDDDSLVFANTANTSLTYGKLKGGTPKQKAAPSNRASSMSTLAVGEGTPKRKATVSNRATSTTTLAVNNADDDDDDGLDDAGEDIVVENGNTTDVNERPMSDFEVVGVEDQDEETNEDPNEKPHEEPDRAAMFTSDARDEHGTAHEASKRSVNSGKGANKRLPKAAFGDNDEVVVQPKRSRRSAAVPTESAGLSPQAQADENEKPSERRPKPQKGPKRKNTAESAESDIVVAPRSTQTKAKTSVKKSATSPQVRNPLSSIRSTPVLSTTSSAQESRVPKVLLSKTSLANANTGNTNAKVEAFLKQKGSEVLTDVKTKRSHFVCVVSEGRLVTTAKVLRSLAVGKLVVTEDWVTNSMQEDELLDPVGYVHDDLADTISLDRSKLFTGMSMYFTGALVKEYGTEGWNNIKALAKEAGASFVADGTATNGEKIRCQGHTIYFGSAESDPDATELLSDYKKTVYGKDMLAQTILRGELDLESDEFQLKVVKAAARGGQKRRTR